MNPTTQDSLVQKIRCDDTMAWTAFITGHEGMVYDLAQAFSRGDSDQFEELSSEGMVALCESARTFVDGSFGCRFTTYAFTRIRRAMVSYCRTEGGLSTEWLARTCQKSRAAYEKLQKKYDSLGVDRAPTPDELAYVENPYDEITDDDVKRQESHLQGTPRMVPLDSLEESSHFYPLQSVEEEMDESFAMSLSPATRHIWSSLIKQITVSGNISMSIEAERNDIPRDEVQSRVLMALRTWAEINDQCN